MSGRIAALVIEDMDIDMGDAADRWDKYINAPDVDTRRQVGRVFKDFSKLKSSLMRWYATDRIDGWKHDGRVFELPDGSWWSGVSPLTQVCRLKPHTHACVLTHTPMFTFTSSTSLTALFLRLWASTIGVRLGRENFPCGFLWLGKVPFVVLTT